MIDVFRQFIRIVSMPPQTAAAVTQKVSRLNEASIKRVIEPDEEVAGQVGEGMALPAELLSVADLALELSAEDWVKLSREELASIAGGGIRFEALLMAHFGYQVAWLPNLVDPRVTYIFHEIGEETRHSRLFLRLLEQLSPTARNPFTRGVLARADRVMTRFALRRPAFFMVMVLTGEEGPDLLQKLAADHAETDPFVRALSRYHRMEEARHLSYGRLVLPELWSSASRFERGLIRWLGPVAMRGMFDTLVHPGVYETVGLPGWKTWSRVRKTPSRVQLRAQAFRPILRHLVEAGAFGQRPRVTQPWRRLCLVAPSGEPV